MSVERRLIARSRAVRATAAARTDPLRRWAAPVTAIVSPVAWVTLGLALVACFAGFWLEWQELLAAAGFGFAVLALAVAFILGRHQLAAGLDLSRDRVVVGQRAFGAVKLTNTSAVRSFPVMVELSVGEGRAQFDVPSLGAGTEHEDLFEVDTSRRAVWEVGPVRAVRGDPLGLLQREQRLTDSETLYVHPRTVKVQGSASGFVRDLEGATIRKITNSDVAFHALRGYVPGDDRRYIHWKSSGRTGSLMVRQFEETRRSHMLVALSTRLEDYADDQEFEDAVSIAASLGVQVLTEGQTLSAVTSTRTLRHGTSGRLLDEYSGVDYDAHSPSLAEVARRLAREHSHASVAIIVCGSLTDAAEIRKARRYLPLELRAIVVKSHHNAETSLRQMGDLDVATLGSLDDLGTTLRRLSR
ncbi:MAG: DUF58 domain-containing protein [Nocardioides sp.]